MPTIDKKKLQDQIDRLAVKQGNLEVAVRELGADAPGTVIDWYELELRKCRDQQTILNARLAAGEAEEARIQEIQEAEEESALLAGYKRHFAAGTLHEVSPALLKKFTAAREAEGVRKLFEER